MPSELMAFFRSWKSGAATGEPNSFSGANDYVRAVALARRDVLVDRKKLFGAPRLPCVSARVTAQPSAAIAHPRPSLPSAVGCNRQATAQSAAAVEALSASSLGPSASNTTAIASAASTVQWWNPFETASLGGASRRCADAARSA